jgi:excinuclease ABC subunit C
MNMPSQFETLMERIKHLPEEPGCYIMKDHKGKVFYIGKAINLRSRVRNYFQGQDTRPFVSWLGRILADIETIVVRNNTEALLLEKTLIKEHNPRFNIQLKDDKNFIMLRLNTKKAAPGAPLHKRFPRLEVVRQVKNDGARYFGPYPSATQIRETLHLINKHFQLRTCNDKVIDNRVRPCIQHQIGRCPAPCVKETPHYGDEIANVIYFLTGQTNEIEKRLAQAMWQASNEQNYEAAARIRDQLDAIRTSLSSQAVSNVGKHINEDVIAANRTGLLLEIVQLKVRRGHILASHHFSFENQEFPTDELLVSFLVQLYENSDDAELPHKILTSMDLGTEAGFLATTLSNRKKARVEVKQPERGKARALVDIAQKNADNAMDERIRLRDTQTASLDALQKCLSVDFVPHVIECFDVSLFQGTDAVASQVCFVDGIADKSRYRHYNIKTVTGTDDFAMLYEALTRRLKRGLENQDLPDLLLVDGGKGQLSVALAACKDLGIDVNKNHFFVAGIAKARTLSESSEDVSHSPERLFLPNVKDPIVLKPHTAERYLVERIRDEAHRFAITAHRQKRKRRTLTSMLDDIPGIGAHRRRVLLRHLGSVDAVLQASIETLANTPGIGQQLAEQIHRHLHKPSASI